MRRNNDALTLNWLIFVFVMSSSMSTFITDMYKKFEGFKVVGYKAKTIDAMDATLVRCAVECVILKPDCRAFNLHKPSRVCTLITSYSSLWEDSSYDFYFQRDMYEELTYVKFNGRVAYYPPLGSKRTSFLMWEDTCHLYWGNMFRLQNLTEWMWMRNITYELGYDGLWISLEELWYAPGNYSLVGSSEYDTDLWDLQIRDDGKNETRFNGTINLILLYDCALIPPFNTSEEDIIIKNCFANLDGFMCEAAIPDPEILEKLPG